MEHLSAEPVAELPPDAWRENVAAVVMDAAGCVLLGLGTGGNAYWHFPQGGIAGSEEAEDALRRELREEVGLAPESYRIIASYGGLRYRYRRGNDKSARWRGQEQTYFLVLCHAEMPATDCSQTDEFCALSWVSHHELRPELFAPFKRKVVARVLATFFPPHVPPSELMAHLAAELTPRRYLRAGRRLADCPADERALFGGGKEEMANTLERLARRLRAAHRNMSTTRARLLVLVHGAEGCGRKKSLRRLAASLEPLQLHVASANIFASSVLPWELLQELPRAGGISLVMHRGEEIPSLQDWLLCESWLQGQGIQLLKLYLHTGGALEADCLLSATDSAEAPWYIIPAERRWYRDYVMARLVVSAMGGQLPG